MDPLTPAAQTFLQDLHQRFEPERQALLARRREPRTLEFDPATRDIREDTGWRVPPAPAALQDRRVEITGPAWPPKMVINAFNSGAKGFMADFEDALSPTWENVLGGQRALYEAARGTLTFEDYALNDERAVLHVRPRGWHLVEAHHTIAGAPIAGALFDAGLFAFHNARELHGRGLGPFFYLPKLEAAGEAALWARVLAHLEDATGLPRGAMRVTVLIETLPAAFQMAEILHALRAHVTGLNAGRWDYLFSLIKVTRENPRFVLPDRGEVTMTVPFMRAYCELLVATCHQRGAHAMGGMAAVIPSRKDEEANRRAMEAVAADKRREAEQGFDGTWVAHPDSVATALAAFARPNQLDRLRDDVDVTDHDLLAVEPGEPTQAGIRANVDVGIRYIAAWLSGNGAAGIYGLMEDAATAEIARSQIWQWVRHGHVSADAVRAVAEEVSIDDEARALFERVALSGAGFEEYLTLPAYEALLARERSLRA